MRMDLPDTLSLVYHVREPHPREVPLQAVYRNLDVAFSAGRPAVLVNMVQTLDGVVAVGGKAWTIGSAVDHYLFRTLRAWADAVLSGAGTLRENDVIVTTHAHLQAERQASGRPPDPVAVVVTRRAEFADDVLRKRFFARADTVPVVITTELARDDDRRRVAETGAELVVVPATPAGGVDLRGALDWLSTRGVRRVLAEGGPSTNRGLVEAGLVDELFVTVTPRAAARGGQPVLAGLLGGASAELGVISEFQYRAPALREWYFRFSVAGGRS
jgi:riboflavin biosynthesis pyrimidine reductase